MDSEQQFTYLDNNATTQPSKAVCDAVSGALLRSYGNPSSIHELGAIARQELNSARDHIADLLTAKPEQIVFTSGATEANNLALHSIVSESPNRTIITSAVEHPSILKHCEHLGDSGSRVIVLPVDKNGQISLEDLEKHLKESEAVVSIQWANSETGVLQPIDDIASLCHEFGAVLHTDAVQAVGRIPIDVSTSTIDCLSLTAHKLHGPKGIGALFIRQPEQHAPMMLGGSQEFGIRAGTENTSGIIGFGVAASDRNKSWQKSICQLNKLRDEFESQVLSQIKDTSVNGQKELRVVNTSNICFHGLNGEALIARLEQANIFCSQNSACNNHKPEPSHVLRAMGLSEEESYSSLRFSFSVLNTHDEVNHVVSTISDIVKQMRVFNRNRLNVNNVA